MVELSSRRAGRGEGVPAAGGPRLIPFRWPEDVEPGNVARLYARMARDLRDGTRTAPSFEDGVAMHRIIAAIEKAANAEAG